MHCRIRWIAAMVFAFLVFSAWSPAVTADPADTAAGARAGAAAGRHQVIVYYFHGTRRCRTCRTIEAYAGETLKTWFPKELKSGALTWKVVNVEEAGNRHFIRDFQLPSSSLVVVETAGGKTVRYEILPKVWMLTHNEEAFSEYVRTAVRRFLEAAS